MADDPKDKIQEERREIAKQKRRASDLLLTKLSLEQRNKVLLALEALTDVEDTIKERDSYRGRGNTESAKKFEPKIARGLEYTTENLDEVEKAGEEGGQVVSEGEEDQEEDRSSEDQQDNELDNLRRDRRQDKNKRPQERETKPKSKEPSTAKAKPTAAPKTPVAKPPVPAGGGVATGGRAGLAVITKTPYFWIAVGILAVIILIIVLLIWLGGGVHKSFNESGGSFPIAMNYSDSAHRDLVAKVMELRDGGALVFTDGTAQDIEWQNDGGNFTHKLDWRVMVTLKYLGEKWLARTDGIIQVSLLASNAPDSTRRKAVMKVFGVAIGDTSEEPLDAPSAYTSGQGIGINVIGRVSNELAVACFKDNDNNRKNNAPVEVKWQEITSQEVIRPIYEQLQVDSKQAYEGLKVMQGLAQQAKKSPAMLERYTQTLTAVDSIYTMTGISLDNMIENLQKINGLRDKGIDQRTKDYAATAIAQLSAVRGTTRTDVLAWDNPATVQSFRRGLESTFRMMQVANMVGWKTPAKPNCRLWEAYEARQHIRQLALDLEQMPADPTLIEDETNWNADLMVRQLIVYSPEDDLDNGLPDMDIFPKGAVAVDEGGVGFDDTGKDGKTDQKDNQFMDLPIDAGVFSKAATIFVYQTGIEGIAKDLALNVATGGAVAILDQMHDAFSGTGTSTYSGENLQKVTYKNFVHIGF